MAETLSHHPKDINIWGKQGCELPNGNLCTACCGPIYRIKNSDGLIFKHEDESCQFTCASGCSIHNQKSQPEACKKYHCSKLEEVIKDPLADPLAVAKAQSIIEKLIDHAHQTGNLSYTERDRYLDYYNQKMDNRNNYSLTGEEDE